MAKTRALLTETEREQIAGEHGDRRRYEATSRVRRRIEDELTTDVALLAKHHPDLFAELREAVCENVVPSPGDPGMAADPMVAAAQCSPKQRRDDREQTGTPPESARNDSKATTDDRETFDTIEDVLADWRPGRTYEERKPRKEAGSAALRWLRDHDGHASGGDFQAALLPEHDVEGQSEKTWWRKTVRPALQHAEEQGVVEYRPGHHDYRWVAE